MSITWLNIFHYFDDRITREGTLVCGSKFLPPEGVSLRMRLEECGMLLPVGSSLVNFDH